MQTRILRSGLCLMTESEYKEARVEDLSEEQVPEEIPRLIDGGHEQGREVGKPESQTQSYRERTVSALAAKLKAEANTRTTV